MRTFLQRAALLALPLISACGGGTPGQFIAAPTPIPTATPIPVIAIAPPVAGSPISHVIVLIQENRTVDNLFSSSALTGGGPYPGANVVTTWKDPAGTTHPLTAVPFEYLADPDHSHPTLLNEATLPNGLGFFNNPATGVGEQPNPPPGFVYATVPAAETLLYHDLAAQYALADNMFSSRLVPSFPGHLLLIAGKSDPSEDPTDPVNWGCDSKPGTTVGVFGSGETEVNPGPFPCFDYQTLGDLMDKAGVTWRYYTGQIGNTIDAAVNTYDAIQHIRNGPDWTTNIVYPQTNILNDISTCNLPNVSYVTPPGLSSDHAGSFSASGPGWVGSIYLAIAESQGLQKNKACQYYGNTAILVTWDDSGGWYDHVAPPTVNGQMYGFRVPLIVMSAWAQHGSPLPYVSHTQREFGSILKFIEKNWNLGSLGTNDATADDLSDMFNYAQKPIAPLASSRVRRLIQQTHFDLNKARLDRTPVDTE